MLFNRAFCVYYSDMLNKGLVQIYTGRGKGKTTAAFGLAMRAVGQGNRVLIYQFLKPAELELGERISAQKLEGITLKALDQSWDMTRSLDEPETMKKAQQAIAKALVDIAAWAADKTYDVIILDEIVFCVAKDLATPADLKKIIDKRDPHVEIVLTGSGASEELIELADLVTEMKPVKHPFYNGIPARKGIEF